MSIHCSVETRPMSLALIRRQNYKLAQTSANLVRPAPKAIQRSVSNKVPCIASTFKESEKLPVRFVILQVRRSFNEEQREYLGSLVPRTESGCIPGGMKDPKLTFAAFAALSIGRDLCAVRSECVMFCTCDLFPRIWCDQIIHRQKFA